MSAPHEYTKESQNIEYSFLALRSQEALKKILEQTLITDDEIEILDKASIFLQDIAEGANLISTGKATKGHNVRQSIEALDYAIDPLKTLKDLQEQEDIADFFRKIAEAVHNIDKDTSLVISSEKRKNLEAAMAFFDALFQSLHTALTEYRNVKSTLSLQPNLKY